MQGTVINNPHVDKEAIIAFAKHMLDTNRTKADMIATVATMMEWTLVEFVKHSDPTFDTNNELSVNTESGRVITLGAL